LLFLVSEKPGGTATDGFFFDKLFCQLAGSNMVPKNLKDVFYRQVDLVTTKPLTMENVLVAYTQHLAALPGMLSQSSRGSSPTLGLIKSTSSDWLFGLSAGTRTQYWRASSREA
jgi:hypothetical protein